MNRNKSGLILPRRASDIQIRRLVTLTGFSHQSQPFTYLGVPLFKGAKKSFLYDDLIMKVRRKISGWASRLLSPGGRITLLRSVLSSIPLYLFQIMRPPKIILKKLESIFARFLWDSKDHARRLHWRSWKAICLPVDDGGLGFRRLQDTVDTFSLKLWWMFRSQSSLWAQFLLGKYCRGTHPSLAAVPHSASPIWKRLKRFGPCAETHIAWRLGIGQIFFWHDCWMGDSTLASSFPHRQHTSAMVQDFFDEVGWDFGRLLQALPSATAEQIAAIPLCLDVSDRIFWRATSDGRFTTKSAWQLIRPSRPVQDSFRLLWSPIIPPTISFFCWRLWQDLIPADVIIQRRIGSQLASRCQCHHAYVYW